MANAARNTDYHDWWRGSRPYDSSGNGIMCENIDERANNSKYFNLAGGSFLWLRSPRCFILGAGEYKRDELRRWHILQ